MQYKRYAEIRLNEAKCAFFAKKVKHETLVRAYEVITLLKSRNVFVKQDEFYKELIWETKVKMPPGVRASVKVDENNVVGRRHTM